MPSVLPRELDAEQLIERASRSTRRERTSRSPSRSRRAAASISANASSAVASVRTSGVFVDRDAGAQSLRRDRRCRNRPRSSRSRAASARARSALASIRSSSRQTSASASARSRLAIPRHCSALRPRAGIARSCAARSIGKLDVETTRTTSLAYVVNGRRAASGPANARSAPQSVRSLVQTNTIAPRRCTQDLRWVEVRTRELGAMRSVLPWWRDRPGAITRMLGLAGAVDLARRDARGEHRDRRAGGYANDTDRGVVDRFSDGLGFGRPDGGSEDAAEVADRRSDPRQRAPDQRRRVQGRRRVHVRRRPEPRDDAGGDRRAREVQHPGDVLHRHPAPARQARRGAARASSRTSSPIGFTVGSHSVSHTNCSRPLDRSS